MGGLESNRLPRGVTVLLSVVKGASWGGGMHGVTTEVTQAGPGSGSPLLIAHLLQRGLEQRQRCVSRPPPPPGPPPTPSQGTRPGISLPQPAVLALALALVRGWDRACPSGTSCGIQDGLGG